MTGRREYRLTITDDDGNVVREELCYGAFFAIIKEGGAAFGLNGAMAIIETSLLLLQAVHGARAIAEEHLGEALPPWVEQKEELDGMPLSEAAEALNDMGFLTAAMTRGLGGQWRKEGEE